MSIPKSFTFRARGLKPGDYVVYKGGERGMPRYQKLKVGVTYAIDPEHLVEGCDGSLGDWEVLFDPGLHKRNGMYPLDSDKVVDLMVEDKIFASAVLQDYFERLADG